MQTFRKLKDRLEYHGVDYHTAAAAASNYAEATDFTSEKVFQLPRSFMYRCFLKLPGLSRQKIM